MSKDSLKKAKRIVRAWLVKGVIKLMASLGAGAFPKLKKLLLKLFPIIFKKEIERAKQLLPMEFEQNKDEIIKKMCENQVLNLLEVVFYDELMAADPNFITIKGEEYLKAAHTKGKGFIILTAHFGSWELIAYTVVRLGYKMYAMARAQAVSQMTNFINSFRTSRGVEVVLDNLIFTSIKVLRKNDCIGLLCDLNAKKHGYQGTFFGRKASFYPLPVLLALRTGASVIPTFIERQPNGRHIMRFEKPLEFGRNNTMCENIKIYAKRYESAIRAHPGLWCWFHERYKFADEAKIA